MVQIVPDSKRHASTLGRGALVMFACLLLGACRFEELGIADSARGSNPSASGVDPAALNRTISSTAANQPPVISGAPSTAAEAAKAWSFAPSASDPEGARLTFTIANKPDWLAFDAATGALSGTPAAADVRLWANITISVSDGGMSSSLAPFSLTVSAAPVVAAARSATLRWVPPSTNEDSSPLTDLAGFRVYYGRAANSLDQIVRVTDPATTQQVVDNLVAGTWYFAVTALSASGAESALSAVASKTLN